MTTDELDRVQQLSRDQVVVSMQDLAAALEAENPSDETLDRWDAFKERLVELDAADAAAQARVDRISAAKHDFQQMKKAVRTPRPESGDGGLTAAFEHYLRTGDENQDIAELRSVAPGGFRAAQSEGTGSEGGYLVPDEMARRMVDRMVAFGGVMAAAEVITTSRGNTIPWVDLDDTGNEGEQVAENASAASGADLAFTKHEIGAYRFDSVGTGGNPLRIPRELLEDSDYDIVKMIEEKLPQRIMRHVADKFINGTGANEPQGLLYGLTGIELNDDTAGVTYGDLIDFEHSVDPAYRKMGNCSWVMNDTSWATIKKILDSNGDPLWTNAAGGVTLADGTPQMRLNGYPVVIDQACDDLSVADNTQNWGAFGDIREGFVIRMVGTPRILVDPYTRTAQNQIQYVANQRMDSIRNNDAAYVALTGEA